MTKSLTIMTRKSIILEDRCGKMKFLEGMDSGDIVTEQEITSGDQPVKIKGDLWVNF